MQRLWSADELGEYWALLPGDTATPDWMAMLHSFAVTRP